MIEATIVTSTGGRDGRAPSQPLGLGSAWAAFLVLLPVAALGGDLLDIHDLAVDNDPRFRAARHAFEAAEQATPIARASLLPNVSASAAYGVERTEITGGDGDADSTGVDTTEPFDYGVTLTQPLFDREAYSRVRGAYDEVAAAREDFRSARQSLVLRVAAAYFDLLAARDDLRLARAENEAVKRQLDQAESRFRAGIAAKTAVQEAQAQHDLTLAAIVEAERVLLTRRQAVAEITGEAPATTAELGDEVPLEMPEPPSADAWVEKARNGSPEITAAAFREQAAGHEIAAASSGHWPSVVLEGSQTFGRSSGFNQGEFDTRGVFVGVDVPIFQGLETVAGARRARSLREVRRAQVDAARRTVEREVRDAHAGVSSGIARVRALRQAVRSNRTALEATEAGLRVGTRTIVDVLDRQRLLFQAERDLSRSRYDFLLDVLRLKRAAGEAARKDLARIDALLE